MLRLLLVEDDPTFAYAIEAALTHGTSQRIECHRAANLAHAVTLLNASPNIVKEHLYDVILLDLTLPDSQGLATVVQMRQVCSGIPIIVLTGKDDERLAMASIKEGAQDYLLKGEIGGKLLARAIQYAMERGKISAEREDFVATLTHDLKGPLQGANRILEMLVKGQLGHLDREQAEVLSRLVDSNNTLLEMIANLLEVYRYDKDIHSIAFSHTNLVNLASSCLDEVLLLARERSIEVRREIGNGDELAIMADPSSIRRVLRNLLDNALKFTPDGGVVTVRISRESEKVLLAVSDTGPGISEEDRRFLFERFYRGSTGRGYSRSTGLGLYLCRQIVQHHNGTITCDRASDSGSVFRLEFPCIK